MAAADPFAAAWRALADPHRRAILDRLRGRPHTTGELANAFPRLSRFAVMKHLGVLTAAGLVLVRRDGRERWNRLNPVPLRAVVRRWLKPFEVAGADALLRVKAAAESEPRGDPMDARPAGAYELAFEVAIQATPAKVWAALTADTAAWWPPHFYTHPSAKRFVLEGAVGGRVYEDWGDGAGGLWGTVIVWDPPNRVTWAGEMYPDYGGPGRSFVTFTLTKKGKGTVLRMTDAGVCPNPEKASASLQSGWEELIGGALKTYVEAG